MDTIFAPATAQGRAGVSIVRVSGPLARAAVGRLAGELPDGGRTVRMLRGRDGVAIDEALILVFPTRASFTGEETVECHCHGSPAVVAALLAELGGVQGLRFAEAGEFTRRALENGRLDLAQVEGLADLIDAETESQRRQALRVFSGELGRRAETWRNDLIRAMALVEATIDFADEEVPVDVSPEVKALIEQVLDDVTDQAEGVRMAERIRSGFEVAIVGPPNVGKSTLLNRLAGREAAITSELAGTTRDVIEVRMDVKGFPVTILDTAGIREAAEGIEAIGIERGLARARNADIRVHLVTPGGTSGVPIAAGDIVRIAKDDSGAHGREGLSAKTGHGIDDLIADLGEICGGLASGAGLAIRERHAEALRAAKGNLSEALAKLDGLADMPDVVAEELRMACRALDRIVGRVDVEDVLGEIFASFCIGK